MTHYTIKTTLKEADEIAKGMKNFVFRSEKMPYGFGDEISFQVYKDGGFLTGHALDRKKFVITYVSTDAPIERGFKVLGFKEIRK